MYDIWHYLSTDIGRQMARTQDIIDWRVSDSCYYGPKTFSFWKADYMMTEATVLEKTV